MFWTSLFTGLPSLVASDVLAVTSLELRVIHFINCQINLNWNLALLYATVLINLLTYLLIGCHLWGLKARGKAEHLYSTLHGIQTTLKRSDIYHIHAPATNTMPALPRKRSPDGATTDWGGGHLIAAYCSFIDPERMKGWVVPSWWAEHTVCGIWMSFSSLHLHL